MYTFDEIKQADPEIAQSITDEMERQNSHIELIASENWVSRAVMAATVLRRVPVCGCSRRPCEGPGKETFWL